LNEWSSQEEKGKKVDSKRKKEEEERPSEIFDSEESSSKMLKKSSMISASKALKSYVSYSKLKDVNDFIKLKKELELVSTLVDLRTGAFKNTSKNFEFVEFSKISTLNKSATIKLLSAINSMLTSTRENNQSDLKTILKLIQKESDSSISTKTEKNVISKKEETTTTTTTISTKEEGDSAVKFFMKISRDKFIEEQFSTLYLGRDKIFDKFYLVWVDYRKYLMTVFEKLANDLYNDFRSTKKDKEEKNYKLITTMLDMFDSFVKSIDGNNILSDDFWHNKKIKI